MHESRPKLYYVYIMASGPRGVLYVADQRSSGRAWQHRERVMGSQTLWVGRLVYARPTPRRA